MDNDQYLSAITALKQQVSEARHRGMIVLAGSRAWAVGVARSTIDLLDAQSVLWFTDQTPQAPLPTVEYRPINKALRHLGSEQTLIVWDAFAGLHPDGFGAITGTLKGIERMLQSIEPEIQVVAV